MSAAVVAGGRCGTYAGYQIHGRERTERCDPCRKANAEYTAALRANNGPMRARQVAQAGARARALSRLALMFPVEYYALLAQEES